MTTVEVLRKAKALIMERGWTQGEHVRFDPSTGARPICVEGALNCALNGSPDDDTGLLPAFYAFARTVGESAHVWNDTPGRTVEEVIQAFDRAISLASETERGR